MEIEPNGCNYGALDFVNYGDFLPLEFLHRGSRGNMTIRGNMSHPKFGRIIKFCYVIALGSFTECFNHASL